MSTAQLSTPGREIEISEPSGVVKRRKVTPHALDTAAKELGLITVNARGMRNTGIVGRFLDQVGVIEYGQGRLIGSAEALEAGINRCAALADSEKVNDELKATFLELKLRFARALNDSVSQLVDLGGTTKAQNAPSAPASKPFLVGAQVSPINIQINAVATPEIKEVK